MFYNLMEQGVLYDFLLYRILLHSFTCLFFHRSYRSSPTHTDIPLILLWNYIEWVDEFGGNSNTDSFQPEDLIRLFIQVFLKQLSSLLRTIFSKMTPGGPKSCQWSMDYQCWIYSHAQINYLKWVLKVKIGSYLSGKPLLCSP